MDESKVSLFIKHKRHFFEKAHLPLVQKTLDDLGNEKYALTASLEWKSPRQAFLLSLFLGFTGADRFYLGDRLLGFAKMFTLGGLGLGALVDVFFISRRAQELNYQKFCRHFKKLS
jgi:TM2 domain-containing membrane protein YozV